MIKLGDKVSFTTITIRDKHLSIRKGVDKILENPITGIVIGVTLIQEGYTDSDCDEYGGNRYTYFVQQNSIKVYKVAINLRKSYLVKPENIKICQ